ncbi:hypothetical protein LCGC14_0872720 [marine sediment metagenome]|uniref:Uncharacterized protein n=1 Tax=marine sediment metagenome TaxID=412755 RepID=A0A0F9P961_9ZZZZ
MTKRYKMGLKVNWKTHFIVYTDSKEEANDKLCAFMTRECGFTDNTDNTDNTEEEFISAIQGVIDKWGGRKQQLNTPII